MKQLFLFLLLVITACVNAQEVINNNIILGHTDSIQSKILQEKRTFWVRLPVGAASRAQGNTRYPVVYVLDGAEHFASVSGMIQYLSEANGNMICPDMIVVGINNTDRTRDLTPTNGKLDFENKPTNAFKTSGGGEKFTAFMKTELIPYIESKYPTAPFRMLIGHSFGGLTAVNILINHTGLFNAYTIVDPSMWWDNHRLLKQASDSLKKKNFTGSYVFMGIANTMPAGADTAKAHHDTAANTNHIRSILNLADEFKRNTGNGLTFNYRYYGDDNHNSSPLITEYGALRFLFSYYRLPANIDAALYDAAVKLDVGAVIADHFADVSKHMGYKVLPPQAILDAMGHDFLEINLYDRAYAVFMLNAAYYPGSAGVFAALGDYYVVKKDKGKAVEFYNKALKLHENTRVRNKLNSLKP